MEWKTFVTFAVVIVKLTKPVSKFVSRKNGIPYRFTESNMHGLKRSNGLSSAKYPAWGKNCKFKSNSNDKLEPIQFERSSWEYLKCYWNLRWQIDLQVGRRRNQILGLRSKSFSRYEKKLQIFQGLLWQHASQSAQALYYRLAVRMASSSWIITRMRSVWIEIKNKDSLIKGQECGILNKEWKQVQNAKAKKLANGELRHLCCPSKHWSQLHKQKPGHINGVENHLQINFFKKGKKRKQRPTKFSIPSKMCSYNFNNITHFPTKTWLPYFKVRETSDQWLNLASFDESIFAKFLSTSDKFCRKAFGKFSKKPSKFCIEIYPPQLLMSEWKLKQTFSRNIEQGICPPVSAKQTKWVISLFWIAKLRRCKPLTLWPHDGIPPNDQTAVKPKDCVRHASDPNWTKDCTAQR